MLSDSDLLVETYRPSGAAPESDRCGLRLTHKPTGYSESAIVLFSHSHTVQVLKQALLRRLYWRGVRIFSELLFVLALLGWIVWKMVNAN